MAGGGGGGEPVAVDFTRGELVSAVEAAIFRSGAVGEELSEVKYGLVQVRRVSWAPRVWERERSAAGGGESAR